MNVLIPGCIASICCANPDMPATDALIGRSPVCSDQVLTWAGAVSQSRNCSAALTWLLPLLNTTQLSGPDMVWCAPLAARVGRHDLHPVVHVREAPTGPTAR